ncbi:MAG: ABC transporter permease [Anaerolineae bacterium]|nr:ABC transporter permease [Anaerolineae bacterium]
MTDLTVNATPAVPALIPALRPRRVFRRLARSRNIVIGAIVLIVLILLTLLAPAISSYDPIEMVPRERLKTPSPVHPFGTDDFGRDVLTRVLYGARISLQVGLISVAIASVVGTVLGLLAGYYGGWVDALIMRFIDVLLAFPSILLALGIVAVLGRNLSNVMLAVGVAAIPFYTRVVRGSTLSVKQMDYIAAAHVSGCPAYRIMWAHILPNVLAPIIVITTNGVAGAIISGAALSFLGLGAQPPTPEWGVMLSEGRQYLRSAWWVTTFPGLAIMITVMAINLLGDGLRDVLDPRLKL